MPAGRQVSRHDVGLLGQARAAWDARVEAAADTVPPRAFDQVVILVPSGRARAWVLRLFDRLEKSLGLPTRLLAAPWVGRAPRALPMEWLEALVLPGRPSENAAWIETGRFTQAGGESWSETLVVNATECDPGDFPPELRDSTIISPVFHGRYEAAGLVQPLLSGESPQLAVHLDSRGRSTPLITARAAAPQRALMRNALDGMLARATTLVIAAAEDLLQGRPPRPTAATAREQPQGAGNSFWTHWPARTVRLAGAQLRRPFARDEWWCVGLRRLQTACPPAELDLSPESFHLLETGGDRFYADPFLCRHQGITALFVEDFDYRVGRGAISCLVLDETGRPGPARQVLRRPHHLSYPQVFVLGDATFMVPETSENRTIELYQCDDFPGGWRLRQVLIENIDASDATLWFDAEAGLWWIFAAVGEFGSSSHDALYLFYSDRLEGPWRPHLGNPVKLEPGCTRPAGPLVQIEERVFRPTQDCTSSYGSALVWCEIKRLTPTEFVEDQVARQAPDKPYTGLHTYGRAAGYEVVDFKRRRWRWSGGERRRP